MKLITTKLFQQLNGQYKVQAFEGSILFREISNLELKEAAEQIEQIMEEGRSATQQRTGSE